MNFGGSSSTPLLGVSLLLIIFSLILTTMEGHEVQVFRGEMPMRGKEEVLPSTSSLTEDELFSLPESDDNLHWFQLLPPEIWPLIWQQLPLSPTRSSSACVSVTQLSRTSPFQGGLLASHPDLSITFRFDFRCVSKFCYNIYWTTQSRFVFSHEANNNGTLVLTTLRRAKWITHLGNLMSSTVSFISNDNLT